MIWLGILIGIVVGVVGTFFWEALAIGDVQNPKP